jgi:hypothetical protein
LTQTEEGAPNHQNKPVHPSLTFSTPQIQLGRAVFTITKFSESLTEHQRKILRDSFIFSAIHKNGFIHAVNILVMNKHNTLFNAIHATRQYTKSQWTIHLIEYLAYTTNNNE